MPFFKNAKDQICQVLEPEIALVVKAGWKELNAAEEAAYREGLAAEHDLTSAAAIEAARVKAGLYKLAESVIAQGEKVATDAANTAKQVTAKKPAANTASEGTSTNGTK